MEEKAAPKKRAVGDLLQRLLLENPMYPDPPGSPGGKLTDDEKKSLRSDGLSFLAEDGLDYLTIKGRITVAQLRGNKEKKT